MDKFAQIKEAEVRGVLAACVDAGILKVANEEQFDALSSATASQLEPNYDVNAVIKTAADVLNAAAEGQTKTAADQNYSASMAALGELLMLKTAGQIDDATFQSNAEVLMKQAAGTEGVGFIMNGADQLTPALYHGNAELDPGLLAKLKYHAGEYAGRAGEYAGRAGEYLGGKIGNVGAALGDLASKRELFDLAQKIKANPRLAGGLALGAGALGTLGAGLGGYELYDNLKEASEKCCGTSCDTKKKVDSKNVSTAACCKKAEDEQSTDNNGQPAGEVTPNLPRVEKKPEQDPTSIHPEAQPAEKQASLAEILYARHM